MGKNVSNSILASMNDEEIALKIDSLSENELAGLRAVIEKHPFKRIKLYNDV